jgi:hypothetical protein
MGTKQDEDDGLHLLRDAVIGIVGMSRNASSENVKLAMDILLAGTSQLGTILQRRCTQLAKQNQPQTAKPSKAAPQKAPKQQKRPPSSTDTPKPQKDAEVRAKELSSIQQGILQAEPSLTDQRRAALGKVYGAQNDDGAFRKAAKAIAS